MKELARLRELCEAATSGPFDVERRDDDCGYMNYIVHGGKGDYAWCRDELDPKAKQNAAFIAAANPAVVLALLGALGEAENMRRYFASRNVYIPAIDRFDATLAALDSLLAGEGEAK